MCRQVIHPGSCLLHRATGVGRYTRPMMPYETAIAAGEASGIRLEVVGGIPTWEVSLSFGHQIPEATIEVVSPGYEAKNLGIGIPFYLRMGIKDIVVFDLETGSVRHFRPGESERVFVSPHTIRLTCGFSVTVSPPMGDCVATSVVRGGDFRSGDSTYL